MLLEPPAPRAWAWECFRCGRHARTQYRNREHTTRTYRSHMRRVHGRRRSDYEMPDEVRASLSEQMKALWASGKMARTPPGTEVNEQRVWQLVVDRGYPTAVARPDEPLPPGYFAFTLVVPT